MLFNLIGVCVPPLISGIKPLTYFLVHLLTAEAHPHYQGILAKIDLVFCNYIIDHINIQQIDIISQG